MKVNLRKEMLCMGLCAAMSFAYSVQATAAPEGNSVNAVQQAKKVTGTVSDSQGPLIGATILEKGTSNGVVTDFDGNFDINVQPGCNA